MIALRIIVFYPLMLYKYVYVFVNTAIKQMQNGYGIDSAWYRWKSILFFITSAFEVISSRIFARESFFECSRSFLISLECIQLYGSTVRESRSIPLERIRNPRNCSIQILNWNMVENGIGWKRATEPILILSSTKYNAIILWWHVTSQRVSGQKFDVDDEGQGGWARPLSRLLSLFLFFFFLFFYETTSKLYAANNNNTGSLRKSNVLAEGWILLYARCCLLSLPGYIRGNYIASEI